MCVCVWGGGEGMGGEVENSKLQSFSKLVSTLALQTYRYKDRSSDPFLFNLGHLLELG